MDRSKMFAFAAVLSAMLLVTSCFVDPDDPNNPGGGNTSTPPTVTIRNNTGYTISGIYIKPSTSTDWGNNLWGWSSILDRQSREFTLTQPLSAQRVYDFRLSQSSGGGDFNFRKYGVTVSRGMTLTFTASDLNDGSDLPSITIQNRSGVAFNSLHIKPSASDNWETRNFGSISNNSNLTVTIPVPPSNYTVFDIQTRSTNPTNTYTRYNVPISDGMVLTYTSADMDNPTIASPVIVIQNNTGYTISGIYIKPPTSTEWGSNLWGWSSISDGQSRTFTLTQPISAQNVYDIRLSQNSSGGDFNFRKYNFTVSDGMIITFTAGDFNDGSDLPTITIQNRTGVAFNSVHIKPSASTDWDSRNFGSISNNNNLTVTIPIPPSSFTAFDIQTRSTNPTNTYTRYNVTISDGMVLTYTSADADNPTISSPVIVIQNNTGYSVSGIWIRPSASTSWGDNLWGWSSLSNGQSRTFTLSQPISAQNVYDIRLSQNSSVSSSGLVFAKYNTTVSDGMIVVFTGNDLE
jgi:hypothetical protein